MWRTLKIGPDDSIFRHVARATHTIAVDSGVVQWPGDGPPEQPGLLSITPANAGLTSRSCSAQGALS